MKWNGTIWLAYTKIRDIPPKERLQWSTIDLQNGDAAYGLG